jgi:hypothetical protein
MKRLAMAVVLAAVAVGCDNSPPPPRVPVPAEGTLGPPRYDPAKPLPGQVPQQGAPQSSVPVPAQPVVTQEPVVVARQPVVVARQSVVNGFDPRIAAPPADQFAAPIPPAPGSFDDQPIVRDRPPEQRAFVEAYNAVGRPKMAVFVNRRLDGTVVGVADAEDPTGPSRGAVVSTPERLSVPTSANQTASVPNVVVVPGGVYDEAFVKAMDYEAVENILTDWLSAGGNTEIISPTLARAKLSIEQLTALEKGERGRLLEVSERLDTDILVLVQARPTRQSYRGLEVRLVAEAINTRGGRSIGRAVVDIPPPLEKRQINDYTRFVARKLMDDMLMTWSAPVPTTMPSR